MFRKIEDYNEIVGHEVINQIKEKATKLKDKKIVLVSSTYQGGGVAEMLNSLLPMFNGIGVRLGWRVLHGNPEFFNITKKFHNALQGGKDLSLSDKEKEIYYNTNRRFSTFTHLDHDLVIVHDPQPLPLINFYEKKQPWVLRFHIDLSDPNMEFWNYAVPFIEKYDNLIVSNEKFKKDLNIKQDIIYPAIDPLTIKNNNIKEERIRGLFAKYGIDDKRPILTQISRFDKWKDPEGVIDVFMKVREKVDCQLVLMGNTASDDPEGIKVYENVLNKAANHADIKVLLNVEENDEMVNSLQRKSDVVIQKSLKEGFGLTVTEAMYKGTPVVASNVGGIALQIVNGENGFLHNPEDIDGFSESIVKLIKDKELKSEMGNKAREHIKNNFLITRLMSDWLDVFNEMLEK
jgi:trehalose synthase